MYDGNIAVIGVGSVGSMALWRLSKLLTGVVGFEGSVVGHDNCAVGGDTRLFRRVYKEGLHYDSFLSKSQTLWAELSLDSGRDLFQNCGALNVVHSDSQELKSLEEFAEETSVEYELLSHDDLGVRFPQLNLNPNYIGIYDAAGGFLWTDTAVRSATERGLESGATLRTGAEVVAVKSDSDKVTVEVSDGSSYAFKQAVIACGARSLNLLPKTFSQSMTYQRLVMTWFGLNASEQYLPKNFPVLSMKHGEQHIYAAPSTDGASIKISGLLQNTTVYPNQFDFDQSVSAMERIEAGHVLEGLFHGVSEYPVRATAYPEGYSSHKDPIIDYIDTHKRIFAATAFSGKGFKIAPAVGEYIAQRVGGKVNWLDKFSVNSFFARR